jgi:hypothetical protein
VVSSDINSKRHQTATQTQETAELRICMPTARNVTRRAYQCTLYEAQDVLAEVGDVDLVQLERQWEFPRRFSAQKRLVYWDISKRLVLQNPGLQIQGLTRPEKEFPPRRGGNDRFVWDAP